MGFVVFVVYLRPKRAFRAPSEEATILGPGGAARFVAADGLGDAIDASGDAGGKQGGDAGEPTVVKRVELGGRLDGDGEGGRKKRGMSRARVLGVSKRRA